MTPNEIPQAAPIAPWVGIIKNIVIDEEINDINNDEIVNFSLLVILRITPPEPSVTLKSSPIHKIFNTGRDDVYSDPKSL